MPYGRCVTHHLIVLDGWIDEDDWPRVPCPTCNSGYLTERELKSFADASSTADQRHPSWEPDWLVGSFSGVMRCDNSDCREPVVVAGEWQVVINEGDPSRGQYGELYRVRFVRPALKLIELPPRTPAKVRQGIDGASALLWASPSAAANRLRVAVEDLLTAKKVNKTVLTARGRRKRLTAHQRIDLFRQTHPDVADALEAVKWIGNDGSHDEGLTASQVLDGVQVLELAIKSLYDTADVELRRRIREINRNRGIRRR